MFFCEGVEAISRVGGWRRQGFRAAVLNLYGLRCHWCGLILSESEAEVDHVVPVRFAPERQFDVSNARPACRPCNLARRGRAI